MKNKIISLLLSLLFVSSLSFSQQKNANISFETTHHNYGKIKETDGVSKYKFIFTNTGNEPLVIQEVKPSCGCTSSDYTKAPIPPGNKGFVTADYNPKNRPGKFSKSIRVTTNAQPPTTVLRISGVVEPREKTVEDIYPASIGKFRMKTSHLAFMKINNTEVRTEQIEVINTSNQKVEVSLSNIPAFVTIEFNPSTLEPNQKGVFKITYNPSKNDDWGFSISRMNIKVKQEDNTESSGRLSVSAVIQEDFSHLTEEELAIAPIIKFNNQTFDFKTLKQGETVSHEFIFTNKGKRDLIIRKTKASCGCTAISPSVKVIKPGEKSAIKMTFNSRGKKGPQNKTITITTNDPKNPTTRLKIKGNVLITN